MQELKKTAVRPALLDGRLAGAKLVCEWKSSCKQGVKHMHDAVKRYLYEYRLHIAGVGVVLLCLLCVAYFVSATGAGTVFDAAAQPHLAQNETIHADTPNAVSGALSAMADDVRLKTLGMGRAFYGVCRTTTSEVTRGGKAVVSGSASLAKLLLHGTVSTVRAIGGAFGYVFRGVAHLASYVVHAPGKLLTAATSTHTVSALIRPTATQPDPEPTPVISSETSAAAVARLEARQRAQIEQYLAEQLTLNQQLGTGIVPGDPHHGGYPAKWENAPQDSLLDSWGMYNRECVSYAAWKVHQTYGHMPYWGGIGNANQWVSNARRDNIPTGPTPRVNAVAISMAGYYGHAMWVEKVQGNMIYVSQYNYDLHGHYSEMWVDGSRFTYIYFTAPT